MRGKKAGKRGRGAATKVGVPQVGIVYLVGDRLHVDSTPLDEAGRYADFAIHEGDHISYWAELVRTLAVPDAEYEKYPRGRVAFNTKTGKYTLLADLCILRRRGIVQAILRRMHLPRKNTEIGDDPHYRCFRCLLAGAWTGRCY